MQQGKMDAGMDSEAGWFCITDSALTIRFASEVAARWLDIRPGDELRLLLQVPEVAEAILGASENDFPLTCCIGRDDRDRPPLTLSIHRLAGPIVGFVCYQKTNCADKLNQFGSAVHPDNDEAHRLAMLGRLVGGVVHEFNNILTGILGHVAYLRSILPSSGDHSESIASVEKGARRAAALTCSLLTVARPAEDQRAGLSDACLVVRQLVGLLQTMLPPSVSIAVDFRSEPLWVRGLDGLIGEMVVHLAMTLTAGGPPPSELIVEVQEARGPVYPEGGSNPTPELRFLEIGLVALGRANNEKALGNQSGNGDRLRNTIAYLDRIARSAGGRVMGNPELEGSRESVARIRLPLFRDQVADSEGNFFGVIEASCEVTELESSPRGSERVLVMDDDLSVRNVIAMSLEQLGYEVTAVGSGGAAIEAYREAVKPFDLVVLDIMLPEISGDQVFARIREINRAAPILIMSGFSPAGRVSRLLAEGRCVFMQKPFTVPELARRVRETLLLGALPV